VKSAISDAEATEAMRRAHRLIRSLKNGEGMPDERRAVVDEATLLLDLVNTHLNIKEGEACWEPTQAWRARSTSSPR
jgi:hypothetical protein